jgi:hypothetical protein
MRRQHFFASVADPDPESGAVLTPGSGMGKKQDPVSGSGMINPDHTGISGSLDQFFGLKYLNYLMDTVSWIRDPGWKTFGSGMENIRIRDGNIRIRDKHPGSNISSPFFLIIPYIC